jgi:hypothetical protein
MNFDLIEDPETACIQLGSVLGQIPVQLRQRLPRRKRFDGAVGEIVERISGRQSTEVLAPYKLEWQSREEEASVDIQFSDLYSELSKRRVN